MTRYGYVRCSTTEERQDIERQIRDLTARGAVEIYSEYASGTQIARHELNKLCDNLKAGDSLAVTEVSRLSRSLHELIHLQEYAKAKEVRLECGALTLDYVSGKVDPMAEAMYHMMGVFAELERGVTVDRIKSGLANAKAKGKRMGRPRKTAEHVPEHVKNLLPGYKRGEFNKTKYAELAGISRFTLYKYLRLLNEELTPIAVPESVKTNYDRYQAGELTKVEYAKICEITRPTLDKYLEILQQG